MVGRWQLQPICPSRRPTWSGWYSTPNKVSITWAMRWVVHSSVANPCSPGPALRARLRTGKSCGFKRGGRPALGFFLRADLPPFSQALCQRLADWQETPKWRATSAGGSPLLNKAAAFCRRRCRASKSRFCPLGNPMPVQTAPLKNVHFIMQASIKGRFCAPVHLGG